MRRILLNRGLMIKLINRELASNIKPRPLIYRDSKVKISLANNATTTLSKFVKTPVNIQEIEIVVKAWLIDVKVYDLLLGVSCIKQVSCIQFYGEKKMIIMGQDLILREMPMPMTPLSILVVEFKLVDEEWLAD